MATLVTQIEFRQDTFENLKNVVLAIGEPAYIIDTKQHVVGDGESTVEELAKNTDLDETYEIRISAEKVKLVEDIVDQSVVLERIQGRTLVRNQLVNINNITTQTKNGVTMTNNGDGTFTFSGNHTIAGQSWFVVLPSILINLKHKYFLIGCPKGGSTTTYALYSAQNNVAYHGDFGNGVIFENTSATVPTQISILIQGTGEKNLTFKPQFIDLTAAYGMGNEPATVEEVLNDFSEYISYDRGTFVHSNNKLISTGRNLWKYGDISGNWYTFVELDTPLKAGTYTISGIHESNDIDAVRGLIEFVNPNDGTDNRYASLGRVSRESYTVILPFDTKMLTFYASIDYVTSANDNFTFKDIQIEHGEVATDYELYKEDVVESIGELKEYDYKDNQSGNDVFGSGELDLGTLNYYYLDSRQVFYTTINGKKYGINNLKCEKYVVNEKGFANLNDYDVMGNQDGATLYFKNTTFGSDATAFKNSLQGVKLLYELATPTIVENNSIPTGYSAYNKGLLIQEGTIPYVVIEKIGTTPYARIKNNLLIETGQQRQINSFKRYSEEGVKGPEASTNNAIARFDGTSGKLIQNSKVTISDDGLIYGTITTAQNAQALNDKVGDVNAVANTYVLRDSSGYIHNTYFNSSSPENQVTSDEINQIIVTKGNGDNFYRKASVHQVAQRLNYVRSIRDFANGTLVKTDLDYPVIGGAPFLVHIKSNSYFELYPYNIYLQGYCYDNTIFYGGGISNGYNFPTDIYAVTVDGKLCFWWNRIRYWQGFDISIEVVNGNCGNHVVAIIDSVKPATNEYDFKFDIKQVTFTDDTYLLSGGTSLSKNTNLNNITTIGNYYCSSDDISLTISNKPVDVVTAFILKVEAPLGVVGDYVSQTLRTYNDGKLWFRKSNNSGGSWSGWTQYAQLSDIPSIPNLSLTDDSDTTANPIISGLIVNGHQITVTRKSLAQLGLASAYKYKGSVATVENLPASNNVTGDVYNVESNGVNYAWDGSKWDSLGGTVDLSGYLPLSGGYMTGPIGFKGSKNNVPVIQFIDNTENDEGVGVKIGAGGTTLLGGGESADKIHQALIVNGKSERMIIANDSYVEFYTNCQNGYSSAVRTTISTEGEFTGKLNWSNLLNNPITIKFLSGESVDNRMTDTWKQMGGRTSGPLLAAYYPNFTTANWIGSADSTIVFGAADTKGFLSTAYHSPIFSIGGGNVDGSTDADPRWYMKFMGTNGTTYDFNSFALSSKVNEQLDEIRNNMSTGGGSNTVYEANLLWGGRDIYANYSPVDAALGSSGIGTNYLAFLPAECITVEYSRDAGVTWTDYESTEEQRYKLFAGGIHYAGLVAGKADGNGSGKKDWQLRITVSADKGESNAIYTVLNKFIMRLSTNGHQNCWCTIDAKRYTEDWYNLKNRVPVGGWSGHNVINIPNILYGNKSNGASSHEKIRFTFGADGFTDGYLGLTIFTIEGFGSGGYTLPSPLAQTGHIYDYDAFQNVVFPKDIKAYGNIITTNILKSPIAEIETLYSDQLVLNPNSFSINFRPGVEAYTTGFYYGTATNEGLTLATKQSCTAIQFINGQDPSQLGQNSWITLIPALQIKYNKVAINKALVTDQSPRAELDVNGTVWATKQFRTDGVSSSWYSGRDSAAFRTGTSNDGYYPALSMKTSNGSWELGAYNHEITNKTFKNIPLLTYITDDNYNSNNNSYTYQLQFPMTSGTLATQEQTVSKVHYGTTDQKKSGYYKVNIKSDTDHWMIAFTIRIYQSYGFYDINISGYSYYLNAGTTDAQYWYVPTATLSDSTQSSIEVKFGANRLSAPHDLWVAIPAGDYTGIDIINVTNGYYQFTESDLNDIFSIEYVENLSNLQTTITAFRPIKLNEMPSIMSNYINGTNGYIPVFNSLNSITNSCMKFSKGNHRLVIGDESEHVSVGAGGIGIRDMRATVPTRDMLGDYTFGMYFHNFKDQDKLPGLNYYHWMSILHAKGWDTNYQAWELAGPAGTGDVDQGLFYRCSKGSSNTEWHNWHKIAFEGWVADHYYNRDEVDDMIANVTTGGAIDLTGYLKKTEAESIYAQKDSVPTKTTQLANDSGFITVDNLTGYATQSWVTQNFSKFSGSYNDLTNKPTIPIKVSELENDSGFITENNLTSYATQQWVLDQQFLTHANATVDFVTQKQLEDSGFITGEHIRTSIDGNTGLGVGHVIANSQLNATAIGASSNANASSVAVGSHSTASSDGVAIGYLSNAFTYAIAIGESATSSDTGGMAIGYSSQAGAESISLGNISKAFYGGIAIGYNSKAEDTYNTSQTIGGIAIGHSANAKGDNAIAIGRGVEASSYSNKGYIKIGTADNNYTYYSGTGTTWSTTSDIRDKINIKPITNALKIINAIEPISFNYNMRSTYSSTGNTRDYDIEEHAKGSKAEKKITCGFKAQGIAEVMNYYFNDEEYAGVVEHYSEGGYDAYYTSNGELIPFLVGAIQEQQKIIENQQSQIDTILTKLEELLSK